MLLLLPVMLLLLVLVHVLLHTSVGGSVFEMSKIHVQISHTYIVLYWWIQNEWISCKIKSLWFSVIFYWEKFMNENLMFHLCWSSLFSLTCGVLVLVCETHSHRLFIPSQSQLYGMYVYDNSHPFHVAVCGLDITFL